MAIPIETADMIFPLLLIKVVLAFLAVFLFLYYKFYWEKAKNHISIHFFYTKWRTVKHAVILGIASIGFTIGFAIELFFQPTAFFHALSSVFEIGALFSILYVFFMLTMEDVPHFAHISELKGKHAKSIAQRQAQKAKPAQTVQRAKKAKKVPGKKKSKKKG